MVRSPSSTRSSRARSGRAPAWAGRWTMTRCSSAMSPTRTRRRPGEDGGGRRPRRWTGARDRGRRWPAQLRRGRLGTGWAASLTRLVPAARPPAPTGGSHNKGRRCGAFLEGDSASHRTARTRPPCPGQVRSGRPETIHSRSGGRSIRRSSRLVTTSSTRPQGRPCGRPPPAAVLVWQGCDSHRGTGLTLPTDQRQSRASLSSMRAPLAVPFLAVFRRAGWR
jgi:hypothetical protein